jgi:hypothetical protein
MMNSKQAQLLMVNEVVMWNDDKDDLGTVRQISPSGFFVDWANGQQGWIDFHDAAQIERAQLVRA